MATYGWDLVGCARGPAYGRYHVGGGMGGIVGGGSRASNDTGLEGARRARRRSDGVRVDPVRREHWEDRG